MRHVCCGGLALWTTKEAGCCVLHWRTGSGRPWAPQGPSTALETVSQSLLRAAPCLNLDLVLDLDAASTSAPAHITFCSCRLTGPGCAAAQRARRGCRTASTCPGTSGGTARCAPSRGLPALSTSRPRTTAMLPPCGAVCATCRPGSTHLPVCMSIAGRMKGRLGFRSTIQLLCPW